MNQKKITIFKNINEAILNFKSEIKIDSLAVAEILNKNFMFGDRTLISGIKRTPWLAKIITDKTGWEYFNLKKHEELETDENTITDELFELLCEEIIIYVSDKKRIGVLLSGGMDSRMVAGILDYLIKNSLLKVESVTAYTWGDSNTGMLFMPRKFQNGWVGIGSTSL